MYENDPFGGWDQNKRDRSEARQESALYSDPGPSEPNDNLIRESDIYGPEDDAIDALPLADIEYLASLQFPYFD
jgi:hypothetical protein